MLALTLLTERRDPQALPLIAEALTAGGASLREQLIWLLGTTHDARALPILSGELHRGPRSVQRAALSAIGEIGGEGAGRVLLGVIESLPSLAAPALEALSRTGAEDCVETLLSAARGELGAQVSPIALQALVQHESPEVTALMQQELLGDNPSRVSVAMDYLASHAVRAAVPDILRIARETGQAHVWSAVNALSRIGGAEALAGLEQLASLPGATGQTASEALANLPGAKGRAHGTARAQGADSDPWQTLERLNGDSSPEASTALIDMARGTDPGLSAQALAYLAQREDPESLEAVAALAARGKTPAQRAMALSALGQSGHPNSATILREALRDPSSEVRAQAVQVLAESNSTELELGLLSASRDENPEVVGIATSALAQLATPSAVARLEEIANGRLAQVKPQALHALASIAPARAAGFAERMAASGDRDASLAATQVANTFPRQVSVRILSSALTQGDADVSREALAALSQLGLSKSELTRMIDPLLRDTQLPEDLRSSAEQLLQGARE
jgi:HEAT repeat protein